MNESIAAMSMSMSQQRVQQQVGISVMKMAMDNMEQTGAMAVEGMKELELAAQPNLGANVDVLA